MGVVRARSGLRMHPAGGWVIALLSTALLVCVDTDDSGGGGGEDAEICNDSIDNDADGQIDCADPNCAIDPTCVDDPNPDPQPDAMPDPQPAPQPDPEPDPEPVPEPDPQPDAMPDPEPTPEPDAMPDPEPDDPGGEICDDGEDNDGDDFIDCRDFDCEGHPNCPPEICDNNIDDDDDGFIDCDDFGCEDDPFCAPDPEPDAMPDPEPDDPGGEICDDGEDNDDNGFIDCQDFACSEEVTFGTTTGTNDFGLGNHTSNPDDCELGDNASETVFRMRLDAQSTVCIDTAGSDFDTTLYVRTSCNDQLSEVACNDDSDEFIDEDNEFVSQVQFEADAGQLYFIFVDGFDEEEFGDFVLTVTEGDCPLIDEP